MVQKLALNLCFSAATQITDEQVPYADVALFCEVEGFTGKASSFVLLLRGGISPFSSSIFKDEGVLMDLAKSVILWKEQDKGFSLESKGGGYGPLWMFSNEDLVVDVPKNSYNDVGCAVIDLCSEVGALGKDNPNKNMLDDGSFSSLRNFISFSKSLCRTSDATNSSKGNCC